jgi:hypothetical protein
MRGSRRVLMVLFATVAIPSALLASQQNPSKAVKPDTPSATPPAARRVVTPAGTKDPFIGVWRLNPGKSTYESGGAPTSFTRTYEDRGGGTIFMTTDVTVPQGSVRAFLVYRRDGKPYPEAAAGAEAIRMVAVDAVDRRTEDVYVIVDGKRSEKPNTITIAADGMTMTQVVNVKNAKGQAFTNTVVYDKQL